MALGLCAVKLFLVLYRILYRFLCTFVSLYRCSIGHMAVDTKSFDFRFCIVFQFSYYLIILKEAAFSAICG